MLGMAIIIGLGFLVRSNGAPGYEYLLGGRSFSEKELDSVYLAFGAADLSDYETIGNRIKVPTEFKAQYHAALNESPALMGTIGSKISEAIEATSPFDSNDLRISREMNAKIFPGCVDRDDVRVVQFAGCFCLTTKSQNRFAAEPEAAGQYLERHFAI